MLPVRSALFKQRTGTSAGGLVVKWVTTSEYTLLYVVCVLITLDDTVSTQTCLTPAFFLLIV
jgi:hypothetical protein